MDPKGDLAAATCCLNMIIVIHLEDDYHYTLKMIIVILLQNDQPHSA